MRNRIKENGRAYIGEDVRRIASNPEDRKKLYSMTSSSGSQVFKVDGRDVSVSVRHLADLTVVK